MNTPLLSRRTVFARTRNRDRSAVARIDGANSQQWAAETPAKKSRRTGWRSLRAKRKGHAELDAENERRARRVAADLIRSRR